MTKKLVVVSAVLAVFAVSADAQTRSTAKSNLRLVRAQCFGVPCVPTITFTGGTVQLKRVRQPKAVSNTEFGRINMNGIAPLPVAPLTALVSGKQVYGSDPDFDCPLANTEVNGIFGTSTMTCIPQGPAAKCRGKLFFAASTPVQCSDVLRTITDITVEVYDSASVGNPNGLIAVPGMAIIGRVPDCDSGGSGCP